MESLLHCSDCGRVGFQEHHDNLSGQFKQLTHPFLCFGIRWSRFWFVHHGTHCQQVPATHSELNFHKTHLDTLHGGKQEAQDSSQDGLLVQPEKKADKAH